MSTHDRPAPQGLVKALAGVVGDHGDVEAVVMTTFVLQARFVEEEILLPLLVGSSASSKHVGDALLEQALERVQGVTIFYDQGCVEEEAEVPRHGLRLVGVSQGRFAFHGKAVWVLARRRSGERSLVVLTTSANLTRAGWLTNLELADIDVIEEGEAHGLVPGLQALARRLGALAGEAYDPALDAVRTFLAAQQGPGAGAHPSFWAGDEPLIDFLTLHHRGRGGRLEVVAPYTDAHAGAIVDLASALQPDEIVVRTPTDEGGDVSAGPAFFTGLEAIPAGVARLAGTLEKLESEKIAGKETPRFVHAKMIRWIPADHGEGWVLVGSPNLSRRAFAGWDAGNAETAVLRRCAGGPWLDTVDSDGADQAAPHTAGEPETKAPAFVVPALRVDWSDAEPTAYLCWPRRTAQTLRVWPTRSMHGEVLCDLAPGDPEVWQEVGASGPLVDHARRSSVVFVGSEVPGAEPWPVLLDQIAGGRRPALFGRFLGLSDILALWATTSAARRRRYLEDRMLPESDEDAEVESTVEGRAAGQTFFDAYAGILHAFDVLRRRMETRDERGSLVEPQLIHRLLGDGPSSLGQLAELVALELDADSADSPETSDPVRRVVLCRSALDLLAVDRPYLLCLRPEDARHAGRRRDAWRVLEEAAWAQVDLEDVGGTGPFRQWFDREWEGGHA